MYWFDHVKLEHIATEKKTNEWIMLKEQMQASIKMILRTFTSPKDLHFEHLLTKSSLKMVYGAMTQSAKRQINQLTHRENVQLYLTFIESVSDIALTQNHTFRMQHAEALAYYQSQLITTCERLGFVVDGSGYTFSPFNPHHDILHIRIDDGTWDIRTGQLFHLIHGSNLSPTDYDKQYLFGNINDFYESLEAKAKFFKEIVIEPHSRTIKYMIANGYSEEDALRTFPRP